MSAVGRTPPRAPPGGVPVNAAPAAVPYGGDPGHVAQPPAGGTRLAHHHGIHPAGHGGHLATGHAHAAHATPHAPKPRRPPKPRKGRRKGSSGEVSDEDELDIDGDDAHQVGASAVNFDGGHQDGGDNHDEGDGDSKREDRTLRARFEPDDAAAPCALARLPGRRPGDIAFAAHRYHRGLCDVLVGPQARPDAARRLVDLDLELLRATPGVARIDRGGLARAQAHLLAHAPPVPTGADRPRPDSAAGRGNCIAVMKALQLQHRRSAQEKQQATAWLEVRQRARTP